MSSPKVIVQIAIAGAQIFGKAFMAAGRQAVQNAKHRPEALSSDVGGIRGATSGSLTDRLTREHRMTLDEARLILNVRKEDTLEKILQNYEHLFKVNSAPPAPAKPQHTHAGSKKVAPPAWSHYLQSKVFRARERIEAENKLMEAEGGAAEAKAGAEAAEPSAKQPESSSSAGTQPQDGGKSS